MGDEENQTSQFYLEGQPQTNRSEQQQRQEPEGEKHVNGYGCCFVFIVFLLLIVVTFVLLIVLLVRIDDLKDDYDDRVRMLREEIESTNMEHKTKYEDQTYEYMRLSSTLQTVLNNRDVRRILTMQMADLELSDVFGTQSDLRYYSTICETTRVFGDINGDSYPDLLCVNAIRNYAVYYQDPWMTELYTAAGLAASTSFIGGTCTSTSVYFSEDVTGDGLAEAGCVRRDTTETEETEIQALFGLNSLVTVNSDMGSGVQCDSDDSVLFGDVNGDGIKDVICVDPHDAADITITVIVNGYTGASVTTSFSQTITSPDNGDEDWNFACFMDDDRILMTYDFDGDGDESLYCYKPSDGSVGEMTLGYDNAYNEQFMFMREVFGLPDDCSSVFPAKLNHDQYGDAICILDDGSLFLAIGSESGRVSGSWEATQSYCDGSTTQQWYSEDFNADGLTDILCVKENTMYFYNYAGVNYGM